MKSVVSYLQYKKISTQSNAMLSWKIMKLACTILLHGLLLGVYIYILLVLIFVYVCFFFLQFLDPLPISRENSNLIKQTQQHGPTLHSFLDLKRKCIILESYLATCPRK